MSYVKVAAKARERVIVPTTKGWMLLGYQRVHCLRCVGKALDQFCGTCPLMRAQG